MSVKPRLIVLRKYIALRMVVTRIRVKVSLFAKVGKMAHVWLTTKAVVLRLGACLQQAPP